MGAFLGISLWIALATVVPGLVTISTWYIAIVFINPQVKVLLNSYACDNDWIFASLAVTIMVLTQAFGILLEKYIIDNKKFDFPKEGEILDLGKGIFRRKIENDPFEPYKEYEGLYLLIAKLTEHEDSQGHLKRALAQFFLTNNTLVSFSSGILIGIIILLLSIINVFESVNIGIFIRFIVYQFIVLICLVVTFKVAKIRFKVMGKALYATRLTHIESNKLM